MTVPRKCRDAAARHIASVTSGSSGGIEVGEHQRLDPSLLCDTTRVFC